jgi:hypothetical protein
VLDQLEGGRRPGLGQLSRRRGPWRGTGLLGDLDDDAVGAAGVQERLLPVRVGQVDTDGLDAERPDPGQRPLDVGDDEVKVVGPAPRAARKRSRKAASAPPVGVSSSIFGPAKNSSWPHQYPGESPP